MSARERILSIREKKKLSRSELARRIKRTRRWVWRIETGAIDLRVDDLALFARGLDVPVAELVA